MKRWGLVEFGFLDGFMLVNKLFTNHEGDEKAAQ